MGFFDTVSTVFDSTQTVAKVMNPELYTGVNDPTRNDIYSRSVFAKQGFKFLAHAIYHFTYTIFFVVGSICYPPYDNEITDYWDKTRRDVKLSIIGFIGVFDPMKACSLTMRENQDHIQNIPKRGMNMINSGAQRLKNLLPI